MSSGIQAWIVADGRVALDTVGLVDYLRTRANEYAEGCNTAEDDETATAYRAVCEELRGMADRLEVESIMQLPTTTGASGG